MPKILSLDTNVYLHYQDIGQVNWLEVVQTDAVTIIIPPVSIRELNKIKDLPQYPSRVRKRAASTLKKLNDLFTSNLQATLREATVVQFESRDPLVDFRSLSLSWDIQDDHSIATMIMYRNELPNADLLLLTSDAGLTLLGKANRLGIKALRLPSDLKLPEEPDIEQERIKQLEQELRELKLQLPQLMLVFEDGTQHAKFALDPPLELTQKETEKELNELRKRFPKMEDRKKETDKPEQANPLLRGFSITDSLSSIATEEIVKHNNDLEKFYQAYAANLPSQLQYQNLKRRTIRLAILLTNEGTGPAEDIDIFMHYPDGFTLTDESDFPEPPRHPEPPYRPKSQLDQLADISRGMGRVCMPSLTSNPSHPPPNVSSPNIKHTKSYDVNIHVHRAKHKLQEPFDPLCLTFESFDAAHSFQIDYKILAANIPKEIIGQLHVVIQK